MVKVPKKIKKLSIAIAGGFVLMVGVIMIPYPGPGWLVVFAGLAILSTEFPWAKNVLEKARGFYDKWQDWLKNQPIYIRLFVLGFTALLVLTTMYLLNVFGILNSFFQLNIDWLKSPFIK